ncbi:MAG: OB-fold nucleic acid binding domain-containing protein, partial [Actinomycetes bacterium]
DVRGISETEVAALVAGQPYDSLADAWNRSGMSRPTAERLVMTGAFDALYNLDRPVRVRGRLTRRDLLLQIADLERTTRGTSRGGSRGSAEHAQMALSLDLLHDPTVASGLPELTAAERVRAELDVLGMDVSHHLMDFYSDLLTAMHQGGLPVTRSRDLLSRRSRSEVLVAGVKVATQTPPVRSGRRVIFLTLDDSTGPVDATFFPDAQGPYAATLFSSWLLLVRGETRRTGPRGISLRATGCWELSAVRQAWLDGGLPALLEMLNPPVDDPADASEPGEPEPGEPTRRRVLVHASGFRQSPYADVAPAGPTTKLWHSSPGSSGR